MSGNGQWRADRRWTRARPRSRPATGFPPSRRPTWRRTPTTWRSHSRTLPDRDLTQAELEALAAGIAQQPESWAHHVAFDGEDRVYVSLHRDAHVDVWLLCWTPENDTGWHDHDVSSGAVAVVAGELVENNLTLAHGARETRVGAGRVFSFGPDHIHRLNGAVHGSISVHAYSPPAVADGPVRRQRRRRAASGVALVRRRAAPDR